MPPESGAPPAQLFRVMVITREQNKLPLTSGCASISRSSASSSHPFDIQHYWAHTASPYPSYVAGAVLIGQPDKLLLAGLSPAVFEPPCFSILRPGAIIVSCRHSCRASIHTRARGIRSASCRCWRSSSTHTAASPTRNIAVTAYPSQSVSTRRTLILILSP